MSEKTKKVEKAVQTVAKKRVNIKESDLIDLMDNIVKEAVVEAKKEWISEQAKKDADKTAILECKVSRLIKVVNHLNKNSKK